MSSPLYISLTLFYIVRNIFFLICLDSVIDLTLILFIICSLTCFNSIIFHIVILKRSQYKTNRFRIAFTLFAFTFLAGNDISVSFTLGLSLLSRADLDIKIDVSVSYTHLTLPTNREV